MIRDFFQRRRRLLVACVLALGVIVGALALYTYGSPETRDAVKGLCVHSVERMHPGSVIEVQSTKRETSTAFTLNGTAATTDGETAEFSCFVYSDMHGGWQIAMDGEEPTR